MARFLTLLTSFVLSSADRAPRLKCFSVERHVRDYKQSTYHSMDVGYFLGEFGVVAKNNS